MIRRNDASCQVLAVRRQAQTFQGMPLLEFIRMSHGGPPPICGLSNRITLEVLSVAYATETERKMAVWELERAHMGARPA